MGKKISIIFPCLNEEKTLERCIRDVHRVMKKSDYKNDYEILVCDNGSADKSLEVCKKQKVNFLVESKRGYGNALLAGIKKSTAKYIVMLDCDMSYETSDIPKIVDELVSGNDFVIGNRFKGGVERGAMPLSHRIGSKILTEYANLFFRTKAHDFHCGLRGFDRKKMLACDLKTSGFEFASEMIIKAKKNKLKIKEIKTVLHKDGRNHKPHLRTIRDGFRHLHTINKTKFELSKPFRYVTTFLLSIATIFLITFCSALIPHEWIKDNAIKSVSETVESFGVNNDNPLSVPIYRRFEQHGDVRNYAMAFQTDNSKPLESAIEMNYISFCDHLSLCSKILERGDGKTINYGRYWQGQSAVIHFTLPFVSAGTLIFITTIVFAILYFYLVFKLFEEDKKLAIVFVLSSLAVNIPFTTRSLQYIPIMFIMLVATLLVLRSRKHGSKNLDIIFLVSGVMTCYLDFLTAETLSLTIPLFVYAHLEIKEKGKSSIKQIISMMLLWGIGYAGAFVAKWVIDYLHLGEIFLKTDMRYLFNTTMGVKSSFSIFKAIGNNFVPILPFALLPNGVYGIIGITIICVVYIIFTNRKHLPLLLICLIPLLRFAVVRAHSVSLYYFTYRAVMPIIILVLLTITEMIKNALKKDTE